jgi:predicted O-methyltransferase YrrM
VRGRRPGNGDDRGAAQLVTAPLSTLRSPAVASVLARLRAVERSVDESAKSRVRAHETEVGSKVYGQERADLYGGASLAIAPEVGELLYLLAHAGGARTIVEFGASLGVSTIYLAAALRDGGGGRLITTELQPDKAAQAGRHLNEAGLGDLVEVRAGDARETLVDIEAGLDFLFLDGWNDLYLDVLRLVEPSLAPGGLVVADLSHDDPHCERYRDRVHDPASGYVSVDVPLDAGVVLSTRLSSPR